ncbi:hypothetical protein MLA2C4_11765 [Bacillus mobilis]|nr:hypothetical protein MLA2C4_11765 [Bacillus mobilis]
MEKEININFKNGHLIRQLEAAEKAIKQLREDLQVIPGKYCERCGGELQESRVEENMTVKQCSKCGELHAFPK